MKRLAIALSMILPPVSAAAQEKVEIQVLNDRRETISMRFAYAFRQYTYTLMERDIPIDENITYRFPANIPGCEKLHEWGIADGVLSISNQSGLLCEQRVSLCDKSILIMEIGQKQCAWRRTARGQ